MKGLHSRMVQLSTVDLYQWGAWPQWWRPLKLCQILLFANIQLNLLTSHSPSEGTNAPGRMCNLTYK